MNGKLEPEKEIVATAGQTAIYCGTSINVKQGGILEVKGSGIGTIVTFNRVCGVGSSFRCFAAYCHGKILIFEGPVIGAGMLSLNDVQQACAGR